MSAESEIKFNFLYFLLLQIMREVAWVVFDEIHYMRDKGQSHDSGLSET